MPFWVILLQSLTSVSFQALSRKKLKMRIYWENTFITSLNSNNFSKHSFFRYFHLAVIPNYSCFAFSFLLDESFNILFMLCLLVLLQVWSCREVLHTKIALKNIKLAMVQIITRECYFWWPGEEFVIKNWVITARIDIQF